MSNAQLLWHLARFDVARMRRWWLMYAVLLLANVLHVTGVLAQPSGGLPSVLLALALQFLAVLFAIELTQPDRPYDRHSFLAAKPVPTFILGASKVVPAIVMVISVGVITTLSVVGTGLGVYDALSLLPRAIAFFVLAVLLGMAAGVTTPTVPVAILLVFSVLPLMYLLGQLFVFLVGETWAVVPPTGPAAAFCVVAFSLVWLLVVYARRPRILVSRSMSVLLGMVGFVATCGYTDEQRRSEVPGTLPAISETVIFDVTTRKTKVEPPITFEVAMARNDRRYELRGVELAMYGAPDTLAKVEQRAVKRYPKSTLLDEDSTAFDIGTGWTWASPEGEPRVRSTRGSLYEDLPDKTGPNGKLSRVDSISVEGRLVRLRAERVAERPYVAGPLLKVDGEELLIEQRDGRNVVVRRTMRRLNNREDWNFVANGRSALDRQYAFVVLDSLSRQAYRISSAGVSESSSPFILLTLNQSVTTMYPPVNQNATTDGAGPRKLTVIVYRWVEEGTAEVGRKFGAVDWSSGNGESSSRAVKLR